MSVRAKFICGSKIESQYSKGYVVSLYAVHSGSKENEEFFQATPSAHLTLQTVNEQAAEQFEVGKEYYLDFLPVGE